MLCSCLIFLTRVTCSSRYLFDHPHNIWWKIEIMNVLTTRFSPAPITSSLSQLNNLITPNLCLSKFYTKEQTKAESCIF
jgi:hypothetical protein